jgi:hypothetical protein
VVRGGCRLGVTLTLFLFVTQNLFYTDLIYIYLVIIYLCIYINIYL